MLYCTFYNKLRKLNKNLRIYGDDAAPNRPWGLYIVTKDGMEQNHICGISRDGGMVYELTERRWDGFILRQGWRRVLKILLSKGIINRQKTEYEFMTAFEGNRGRGLKIEKDPLSKAMEEARARGLAKTGVENYVEVDDLVDIHRWREKLRQDKSNYWA
jgi:hypothetical protein